MSVSIWIVIGLVILIALTAGKGKSNTPDGLHRIERPHVMDPDDYECSVCHRRFRKNVMTCPYCGARFAGTVKDEEEFTEEEEELEAWDEEDGV